MHVCTHVNSLLDWATANRNITLREHGPKNELVHLQAGLHCAIIRESLIYCVIPGHGTLKYGPKKACHSRGYPVLCFMGVNTHLFNTALL